MRSVAIDVRVIELGARHDGGARPVVEELGALVEVGGVVLVALDDEVRALPEAVVPGVVQGHAADEENRGQIHDDFVFGQMTHGNMLIRIAESAMATEPGSRSFNA